MRVPFLTNFLRKNLTNSFDEFFDEVFGNFSMNSDL